MLKDIIKDRIDSSKPREEGLTYMIDRLPSIDSEVIETLSPIVDLVKIYGAYPLLIPDFILQKKIGIYHKHGVQVSLGRKRRNCQNYRIKRYEVLVENRQERS